MENDIEKTEYKYYVSFCYFAGTIMLDSLFVALPYPIKSSNDIMELAKHVSKSIELELNQFKIISWNLLED